MRFSFRLFSRLFSRPQPGACRHRRDSCWLAVALALCFAVGCSRLLPGRKEAASVAPGSVVAADAPTDRFLGTVHVIGTGGRFVLVQSPAAAWVTGLVDGQALVCRAAGNVTATLRVSHERRPPFAVADVATGTPNLGDQVFIEPAGTSTASAQSPPPSSTPEFRANPLLPPAR